MWIEGLLELKDSIDKHGLRLGVVFTLYAIYRKERRNKRLDQRDVDIFHNQKIIMGKLGVEHEWRGQLEILNDTEVQSLKKLFKSSIAIRRKKKMQNTNWITLLPALIGAIKLILQPFGIDLSHVTDTQVNDVVNGIAALVTIIGICIPHKKGDSNANTQPTVTIGDNR